MTCAHEDHIAEVNVNRITEVEGGPAVGFAVYLRIDCADCGEPFVFRGMPLGVGPERPHMSVDGTEARLPVLPQSADPHFGLGLGGVVARVREGMPESGN